MTPQGENRSLLVVGSSERRGEVMDLGGKVAFIREKGNRNPEIKAFDHQKKKRKDSPEKE